MATDNKYDRQLRLWGSEGQQLLSESRVCMINSSGLGSEILKNLVLPGLGYFVIVDNKLVTESDLGNNFFVTPEDISKPRGETVKSWLLELNPDVNGVSLPKSLNEVLSDTAFWKSFNLIIASQVNFDQVRSLGAICEENNINLIIVKSNGLLGYLRVYTKESLVIESKPWNKEILDLRLHKPFQELLDFCSEIHFENIQKIYHSHIPFIAILLKYSEEWLRTNPKPATFAEKNAFKDFIKSKSWEYFSEINFNEAVTNSNLCFLDEDLNETSMSVINDPKSVNADSSSPDFWVCSRAVKEFIETNGVPPLTGIFPDMTSDSNTYISLQQVYHKKSLSDYSKVLLNFQRIKGTADEPSIVKKFCRNLHMLEVNRIRSVQEELEKINEECLEDDENELVDWYLALRALDQFQINYSKDPSLSDLEELKKTSSDLLKEVDGKVLEEIIRFGSSELHCIDSLIGGVASQEAIKLITHQYTPINNTFIFNGVYSKSQVLTL